MPAVSRYRSVTQSIKLHLFVEFKADLSYPSITLTVLHCHVEWATERILLARTIVQIKTSTTKINEIKITKLPKKTRMTLILSDLMAIDSR